MFELKFHPAVKRDLKKIGKSVAREIKDKHFKNIKENPSTAENLSHMFKGLKSYHFKSGTVEYRIIYEIYDNTFATLFVGIHPAFSVQDLNAHFVRSRYVRETLKLLPQKPDPILIQERGCG